MSDLSVRQFLLVNRFDPAAGIRTLLDGLPDKSLRHLLSQSFFHADRLLPRQHLTVNDQLLSNNRLMNLIMQSDGNLVLYRTHYGRWLWASNTYQKPVIHTVMQTDGEVAAKSSDGAKYWNTPTSGHPGASLVLQEDGNLVVYDKAGAHLWQSNTIQDISSPTFRYSDGRYSYDETAEWWKQMCSVLPCCDALQWPDYATTHVEDTINGQPVVIQLWKGLCEKFLNLASFPGGIGGEVGVYHRIPGRAKPTLASFPPGFPAALAASILAKLVTVAEDNLWWPFPELNTSIEFSLVNPETNTTFFTGGLEHSYWLAKWMEGASYDRYKHDVGKTPLFSVQYLLDYKINGKKYPRW